MTRATADLGVTGLVLAGGRSTRFGTADENKALATFGDRTVLERVVDTLAASTGRPPVIAVQTVDQRTRYADVLADREVRFARDDPAFEGPVAGVFGGVGAVDSPWVFCCGCDMPLLSEAAIEWLSDRLLTRVRTAATPPVALGVQHPDGQVDPLHTLYRPSRIEQIRDETARTAGPRTLLAAMAPVVGIPRADAPDGVPLAASTTNVNTRDELEGALSRAEAPR